MQTAKHKKNLVYSNEKSGTAYSKEFKGLIKDALYPEDPSEFSHKFMLLTATLIAVHEKSNTLDEAIDSMLFYVECGTQFACDYPDMYEEFYTVLEDMFQKLLETIKKAGDSALHTYSNRLFALVLAAQDIAWGYPEQLEDLIDMEFPGLLKKH